MRQERRARIATMTYENEGIVWERRGTTDQETRKEHFTLATQTVGYLTCILAL
jgi:hypothetical protein